MRGEWFFRRSRLVARLRMLRAVPRVGGEDDVDELSDGLVVEEQRAQRPRVDRDSGRELDIRIPPHRRSGGGWAPPDGEETASVSGHLRRDSIKDAHKGGRRFGGQDEEGGDGVVSIRGEVLPEIRGAAVHEEPGTPQDLHLDLPDAILGLGPGKHPPDVRKLDATAEHICLADEKGLQVVGASSDSRSQDPLDGKLRGARAGQGNRPGRQEPAVDGATRAGHPDRHEKPLLQRRRPLGPRAKGLRTSTRTHPWIGANLILEVERSPSGGD